MALIAVDLEHVNQILSEWRSSVSLMFTWVFQSTKPLAVFSVLFVLYKYGHIHLGKTDKPVFSNFAYLSMIITAGAGSTLLGYSVIEPLSNRNYHFFAQAGYHSQDEIDLFAVNLALSSWGLAGWSVYTIVAIAMSLAVYKFKLPMTYRSCFYPIFGAYTWGWIGDLIDGLTIVVSCVVCTMVVVIEWKAHRFSYVCLIRWLCAETLQALGWLPCRSPMALSLWGGLIRTIPRPILP
jgi:choline/glycine/proline betaine transport protein